MPNLGGWEFVILIGILVLLFGAKRLPDMARSIGQSARVFKGEMKGMRSDDDPAGKRAEPPAAPAEPAALPPTPRPARSGRPAARAAGDLGGDPAGQPAGSRASRGSSPARWPDSRCAGAAADRRAPTARCRSSSTSTSCATG